MSLQCGQCGAFLSHTATACTRCAAPVVVGQSKPKDAAAAKVAAEGQAPEVLSDTRFGIGMVIVGYLLLAWAIATYMPLLAFFGGLSLVALTGAYALTPSGHSKLEHKTAGPVGIGFAAGLVLVLATAPVFVNRLPVPTPADTAHDEAYRATLDRLYSVGEYHWLPSYLLAAAAGSLVAGFGLQWIVFYIPRRARYLLDIDWMILPRRVTEIDLVQVTSAAKHESTRLGPPSTTVALLIFLTILTLDDCKGAEQQSWQAEYGGSQVANSYNAWEESGKAEARVAAEAGTAWRLYSEFALLFLAIGVLVGIVTQYLVLLNCRLSGRLPELLAVAFVPAIRTTLSYSVFERRRRLSLWWDEQIKQTAIAKNLHLSQIQVIQDVMVHKLRAISSLDEFSQASLLELAQKELSRIMDAAEREVYELGSGGRSSDEKMPTKRLSHICPHCGKRIGYTEAKAGKTVNCPYQNCGQPLLLPRS